MDMHMHEGLPGRIDREAAVTLRRLQKISPPAHDDLACVEHDSVQNAPCAADTAFIHMPDEREEPRLIHIKSPDCELTVSAAKYDRFPFRCS